MSGLIWFIVGLLAVGAGVTAIIKGKVTIEEPVAATRDRYAREGEYLSIRWMGVIVAIIGLFGIAIDSFTVVEARHAAVQLEFGKPVDTLHNGFHLMKPWTTVSDSFDATVQTLKLTGGDNDNGDPISVRLANDTMAQVDVSAQWQLDDQADIQALFKDYRNFGTIDANVVQRLLSTTLSAEFELYDPLTSLKQAEGQNVEKQKLSEIATKVERALAQKLPSGIKLRSLQLPKIKFSDQVQAQIDDYLAEVGRTKVAEQAKLTAEARAEANKKLAVGSSWQAIVQNCLDMVERVTKGAPGSLPVGFNCASVMQLALSGPYTQK